MIKNYLKIAWRNLRKHKAFSFINIFGLAVGFTCCMLISSFLHEELTYDRFPAAAKDIYRVELNVENKDFYSAVDGGVGEGIKNNFPEVLAFSRLNKWTGRFVQYGQQQFKEDVVAMVDSNFLQLFSIPFAQGDAATALNEPNSIVLSKTAAVKYFGTGNPMGKTLLINGNDNTAAPYKVTGVIDALPGNLHFNFDLFITFPGKRASTWSNVGTYTYLRLKPGANVAQLEAKFPQLVAKYVVPEIQQDMGVSLAEAQKSVNTFIFYLKPVTSIHLYSENKDELEVNGSIRYVYIFAALAFFILLLACVNFTNLSTAVSVKRSKEVGIRKVMGSGKKQLVGQFLAESSLLSVLAFVFALGLVYLMLPSFNQLSGKEVRFSFFIHPVVLVIELLFVLLAGMLAGLYPAFFLSSFNIISILKGKGHSKPHGNISLRSGLVIFQFAVSITLIICTIIVFQQLHFMQHKALGFDKEQTLVINDTYLLDQNQDAFREQLLRDSRVTDVTISRDVPVNSKYMDGTQAFTKQAGEGRGPEIHINKFHIDYDYIKTLGIQVVNGRAFSKDYSTDSSGVLLNEAAVKEFGFSEPDVVGKTITTSGQHDYKIVGIVKDFHYQSIKEKIAPLVLMLGNNYGGMLVKVKTAAVTDLLAKAKQDWKSYNGRGPFSYVFLDEKFANVYAAEERTGKIFTVFASISIIIAALGLFGLSAFTTEQRTKEIGVRKVLGASVQQVVLLLSKEFLIMVLIAFLIAVPVTWLAMHKWLQEFAYRVDISWYTFAIAGVVSIFIALMTVSFQAIRAAVANPVKSLRSE